MCNDSYQFSLTRDLKKGDLVRFMHGVSEGPLGVLLEVGPQYPKYPKSVRVHIRDPRGGGSITIPSGDCLVYWQSLGTIKPAWKQLLIQVKIETQTEIKE